MLLGEVRKLDLPLPFWLSSYSAAFGRW